VTKPRSVVTAEMLAACRAGSREGWTTMVRALQPFLCRIMLRMLARSGIYHVDAGMREDLLQAGAITLMRLVPAYEQREGISFERYAGRFVRRDMRMELVALLNPFGDRPRNESGLQRVMAHETLPIMRSDVDDPEASHAWLATEASSPAEQVEARDVIVKALGGLDARAIDAAIRHFGDGETLQEIGDSWGVSREAVNQRTKRARTRILEMAA
jgi:RNA polymerase sigma factor (sigma-70 family)